MSARSYISNVTSARSNATSLSVLEVASYDSENFGTGSDDYGLLPDSPFTGPHASELDEGSRLTISMNSPQHPGSEKSLCASGDPSREP